MNMLFEPILTLDLAQSKPSNMTMDYNLYGMIYVHVVGVAST